jgi:hypothetical protein
MLAPVGGKEGKHQRPFNEKSARKETPERGET